jgi:aryl-alcohol dehydrogenase-like predicted oxidoreductase
MNSTLSNLSRYIYGTTRLGDTSIAFTDRLAIAREAVRAGLWIHTSHQYGEALSVLRALFEEDRSNIAPAIYKLGYSSPEEVRGQVRLQLDAVGTSSMAIGQVFPSGQLAEDLCTGGPGIAGLEQLKDEGLVGSFEMEVWPWSSDIALRCIKGGHAAHVIDAYTFYLNPLQRFVTNELWDLLINHNVPIVAMRTVGGGDVRHTLNKQDAPEYLRKRAAEIAPIFEASGVESWTEFAVRFALGFPQVRATVGATARSGNLAEFVRTSTDALPLEEAVVQEILLLQRGWSDDHDVHAAPWSM